MNPSTSPSIGVPDLSKFLGPSMEIPALHPEPLPGTALGLGYSPVGGSVLYIEAMGLKSESKGTFKVTGSIGQVMTESVQIAFSYATTLDIKFGEKYLLNN